MVYLEIIITLDSMTYIIDLDAYELHIWGMKKLLTNLLLNFGIFHYTYGRDLGFIIIQKHICIHMLIMVYDCDFLRIHVITCIFIIEIVHVLLDL